MRSCSETMTCSSVAILAIRVAMRGSSSFRKGEAGRPRALKKGLVALPSGLDTLWIPVDLKKKL